METGRRDFRHHLLHLAHLLRLATTPPTAASAVSTVVTLVTCPTTYGVTPSTLPVVSSTITEQLPPALASRVAVYTDRLEQMQQLGPIGWACSSLIGADGSSALDVHPRGQPDPGSQPPPPTPAEAVIGSQTSACYGCTVGQASALFPAAAALCAREFPGQPGSCPVKAAGESTDPIRPGLVGFLDPPAVHGDGDPSGGPNPANGVMTYPGEESEDSASYLDTCTLPADDHSLCTAVLDRFVQLYGSG